MIISRMELLHMSNPADLGLLMLPILELRWSALTIFTDVVSYTTYVISLKCYLDNWKNSKSPQSYKMNSNFSNNGVRWFSPTWSRSCKTPTNPKATCTWTLLHTETTTVLTVPLNMYGYTAHHIWTMQPNYGNGCYIMVNITILNSYGKVTRINGCSGHGGLSGTVGACCLVRIK